MHTFSIVTITLNNAAGLRRTLESIRALNYAEKEVIVIDGLSSDNTKDVVESYNDTITTFISEKDNGIYNAMNKSLQYITGDYVVFMNAGDCFSGPDVLELVCQYDFDILIGSSQYDEKAHLLQEGMTLYDVFSTGINHQSTYYRTEIIKKYGFDEKYKLIADFKSVVEPLAKDKIHLVSISQVLSMCEGGGISKQKWRDTLVENRKILEEVIDPFYRDDYLRFARINNGLLNDFRVLSAFTSIHPVIRLLANIMRFINKYIKHIPI